MANVIGKFAHVLKKLDETDKYLQVIFEFDGFCPLLVLLFPYLIFNILIPMKSLDHEPLEKKENEQATAEEI
jgi:hypothetical protein